MQPNIFTLILFLLFLITGTSIAALNTVGSGGRGKKVEAAEMSSGPN